MFGGFSHVYANARQFNTVNELREAITAAWERLTENQIENLYRSLLFRMISLLQRKGNVINY